MNGDGSQETPPPVLESGALPALPNEAAQPTAEATEVQHITQAVQQGGDELGLREAADLREAPVDPRVQRNIDDAMARINNGEDVGRVLSTYPLDSRGPIMNHLEKLTAGVGGGNGGGKNIPQETQTSGDDEHQKELARLAGNLGGLADKRAGEFAQGLENHVRGLQQSPGAENAQAVTADATGVAEQTTAPVAGNEATPSENAADGAPVQETPVEGEGAEVPYEMSEGQKTRFQDDLKDMDANNLQSNIEDIDRDLDKAEERLSNRYRYMSKEERDKAEAKIKDMEWKRSQLKSTLRAKGAGNGESATKKDKAKIIEDRAREAKRISGLNLDDLKKEDSGLDAEIESLDGQLGNSPDAEAKSIIEDRLNDARARKEIVGKNLEKKQEEQKKSESEEEAKKSKEGHEQALKENANPAFFRAKLTQEKEHFSKIQGEINRLEIELKEAGDDAKRADIQKKLDENRQQATEASGRVKFYKDGLENAQQGERDEFTLTEKFTEDDLERISRKEYRKMSDDEKARYLDEVRKSNPKLTPGQGEGLRDKVMKGEPLGIKARAQYAEYFAQKLIRQKGRVDGDWETMQMLIDRYPEMSTYVTEKVMNNNEQMKAFREQNPNDWEKIVKFVGRNKHWFMILLAILAAGVAIPAAGGLGAAGVGVGKKLL